MELLKRYNIPISGKRAVVLGRSNIVGMPVAHLLQVSSLRKHCDPFNDSIPTKWLRITTHV